MKNKIMNCLLILAFGLTINSCSTPEERATVVKQNDSTQTHAQVTKGKTLNDSASPKNDSSINTGKNRDSSTNSRKNDTAKAKTNKKVSTFKHTPIDTVTSKSDSLKH
jgi:hypothetical protein